MQAEQQDLLDLCAVRLFNRHRRTSHSIQIARFLTIASFRGLNAVPTDHHAVAH
jgi:hypothetical protein